MPWTAEQAREVSRKGWEASREARKIKAEQAAQAAERLKEASADIPAGDYVAKQIVRTRLQIDLCNDLLEQPDIDWKARKATADAKARLVQVWQVLTQTPNPGQLKPSAEPRRRSAGPAALPLPAPVSPPTTTDPLVTQ